MRVIEKIIEQLYFKQSGNLALYDQMTGLYNSNWLRHIGYKKYINKECIVTMIDVNSLKRMNDTKGHVYADGVLMKLSQQMCMINTVEPDADIIRYGGDEFIVISSQDYSIQIESESAGMLSAGSYRKSISEPLTLAIANADSRMYEHKREFYRKQEEKRNG